MLFKKKDRQVGNSTAETSKPSSLSLSTIGEDSDGAQLCSSTPAAYKTFMEIPFAPFASALNCPRVRCGPESQTLSRRDARRLAKQLNETTIPSVSSGADTKKKGETETPRKRTASSGGKGVLGIERQPMEDWDQVTTLNLAYQDLGNPFQTPRCKSVFSKLLRCETLNISNNGFANLGSFNFPSLRSLTLCGNDFCLLRGTLPKASRLEYLNLANNCVEKLSEACAIGSRYKELKTLDLRGCPVTVIPGYRYMVLKACTSLVMLDGILRKDLPGSASELKVDEGLVPPGEYCVVL